MSALDPPENHSENHPGNHPDGSLPPLPFPADSLEDQAASLEDMDFDAITSAARDATFSPQAKRDVLEGVTAAYGILMSLPPSATPASLLLPAVTWCEAYSPAILLASLPAVVASLLDLLLRDDLTRLAESDPGSLDSDTIPSRLVDLRLQKAALFADPSSIELSTCRLAWALALGPLELDMALISIRPVAATPTFQALAALAALANRILSAASAELSLPPAELLDHLLAEALDTIERTYLPGV